MRFTAGVRPCGRSKTKGIPQVDFHQTLGSRTMIVLRSFAGPSPDPLSHILLLILDHVPLQSCLLVGLIDSLRLKPLKQFMRGIIKSILFYLKSLVKFLIN